MAVSYADSARFLLDSKIYSLASCVMLFYDMFLTFGEEVEKIWLQPVTGATVLWFLNRYITPLGYIVITVSWHDANWGIAACDRFVLFPEILKVFSCTAAGLIFTLRLYAVYGKSKTILFTFTGLLSAEVAAKIWSFTGGTRLQLPPGLVGCILTGKTASDRLMFTWVAELCFDTCVFFAMLYRTLYLYRTVPRRSQASSIVHILMRDGIIYFAVIFGSNLITVLIYLLAVPDLRVINASFSTLITTLMISRLMLNLRRANVTIEQPTVDTAGTTTISEIRIRKKQERSDFIPPSIMGNLGEPLGESPDEFSRSSTFAMSTFSESSRAGTTLV
ncbi:hypothetical protein BDW22DRAFT_447663 [Trametopsis cervina]|nr:hypothetical protein BDW22DRAFT_447663 [Trametopsis cervina]